MHLNIIKLKNKKMDKFNLNELGEIITPEIFFGEHHYFDADEELFPMAKFIKDRTDYNSYIEPDRIKFLYTDKLQKDGSRYTIGHLIVRSDLEKMVNDEFDFIAILSYNIWKELDVENKIIQLDKILCGIDMGTIDKPVVKKQATDSREYVQSLKYWGFDKVLNSSEIVHLAAERLVEQKKDETKSKKIKPQ